MKKRCSHGFAWNRILDFRRFAMARLKRLAIANHPYHILQRGNNRQSIFASPEDRQLLLGLLSESAQLYQVAVHAYVLMDNHFHLLVTPHEADGLSRMMQSLGRRYVRRFNLSQHRTGTLWEGRFRSSLVQADPYLLSCMAYIDLNPIRGGLVHEAHAYPWSSHAHYAGLRNDRLVTAHPLFWALGNTPFDRESNYRSLVDRGIHAELQQRIAQSVISGWPLGDADFLKRLQAGTERRLTMAKPGRPPGSTRNA